MFSEIFATHKYKEIAFTSEEEEKICKIVADDVIAKLNIVKTCMNLAVKLASWYSQENGVQFSQMVRVGIMAIIKAAENFNTSEQINFIDYASQMIVKEMVKSSKPYVLHTIRAN